MPNRIVREGILTSERVDSLSCPAEVFYRRLMSVVDDLGRYDARPIILRAHLYPLRALALDDATVKSWLDECVRAKLIRLYSVDGKEFLQLEDFNQTKYLRRLKVTFPGPEESASVRKRPQSSARTDAEPRDPQNQSAESNRIESNTDHDASGVGVRDGTYSKAFEAVWKTYPKRGEGNNPKKTAYRAYKARLAEGITDAELAEGVARYAAHIRAKGILGTKFVMQAATFFGPDHRFREEYPSDSKVVPIKKSIEETNILFQRGKAY